VIRAVMSPLDRLTPLTSEKQPPSISHGDHGSSRPGDRGYLPRPMDRLGRQANAGQRQSRPVEGDVGDRELPARWLSAGPCHALARTACTRRSPITVCRNRHCPKCQGSQALAWMKQRKSELLDVPYFHVVFTLPGAELPPSPTTNKAVVYDLLFKASSQTMRTIAADPKRLGVKIGFTSVLHTWGSAMSHHPTRPHDRAGVVGYRSTGTRLDRLPSKLPLCR